MKIRRETHPLVFEEDGSQVSIGYGNRGEPFREGVELRFQDDSYKSPIAVVLLETREIRELRDKLNEYLGENHVEG